MSNPLENAIARAKAKLQRQRDAIEATEAEIAALEAALKTQKK